MSLPARPLKRFRLIAFAFALSPFTSLCWAKIADCPVIVVSDTQYSSHANYIQATHKSTGAIVWRTILFTESFRGTLDPTREEDVQWNIACLRSVKSGVVVASDSKHRIFRLNATTGKILAAERETAPK